VSPRNHVPRGEREPMQKSISFSTLCQVLYYEYNFTRSWCSDSVLIAQLAGERMRRHWLERHIVESAKLAMVLGLRKPQGVDGNQGGG